MSNTFQWTTFNSENLSSSKKAFTKVASEPCLFHALARIASLKYSFIIYFVKPSLYKNLIHELCNDMHYVYKYNGYIFINKNIFNIISGKNIIFFLKKHVCKRF